MKNDENNNILKIHKAKKGYVAEFFINDLKGDNYDNIDIIFIVDRSGSMGQSYIKIFKEVVPEFLEKLKYPEDKIVHFITFESKVEYRKLTKKDFLEPKSYEQASGLTYMAGVFDELEKIMIDPNSSYRIITFSDGDLFDNKDTSNKASNFYTKVNGKFNINSQAIRFFSSSFANPDTMGLASVMQLNTIKDTTLIDINASDTTSKIVGEISKLFVNDGLGNKIILYSDKNNIQSAPWEEKKNEINLNLGNNVFWLNDISQFKIKFNDKTPIEVKLEDAENINIDKYEIILGDKIQEFIKKLKILKILNNDKTKEEMEKIIKHFKEFENGLEMMDLGSKVLKDGKLDSRILYIKQLIKKKKGLISNVMETIKNDEMVNQLNSQQKADYLRNIENTKLGKSLAKRAINNGIDFTNTIKNEIKEMKKNISKLDKIDYSSHRISFYSTSSTLESLKDLCNLVDDPVFEDMEVTDFLEIINIVGIATFGPIAEYPDPLLYLATSVYPGCYISVSDIITTENISKNTIKLLVPGINAEINNCIPVFSDNKIYYFLKEYAPTTLELCSGIGMRRVLAIVPNTLEGNILSGVWKMIGIIKGNEKLEVNIQTFLEILNTMNLVIGSHYNNVIKTIDEQINNPNTKKLGLYLNGYGLFQLLPVLYYYAGQNILNKKFLRAIYRFEIYKMIRKNIRKNENKDKYIENTLYRALGIDFDEYGTKIPELFEKNPNPKIYDNYIINQEIVANFKRQMGWLENIPYAYYLFEAAQKSDPVTEIKKIENYNEETKKEAFGINYDFDKFFIFNIVQSLLYKEKIDREDEKNKKMKIIDSNDETEVEKF